MSSSDTWLVLQHAPGEHLGAWETLLQSRGESYRYLRLDAGETLPATFHHVSGLIIMGGPMNVDEEDRYPWLRHEMQFIRQALRREVPMLGVCLGAQLLAKAGGASVWRGPEPEIGWYPLELTAAGLRDPVLNVLPPTSMVFQWHGDTFHLPGGAEHLATSHAYANQAFRLDRCVYGFQFHVEVTETMIGEWVAADRQALGAARAQRILADTRQHYQPLQQWGADVFRRFLLQASRVALV